VPSADDYLADWDVRLENILSADDLAIRWNAEKPLRGKIEWPDQETPARLRGAVMRRIDELKQPSLTTKRLEAEDQ